MNAHEIKQLQVRLTKAKAERDTAEVEEREFEAVPDGKYQVNVDRVELTRAQTSGNPMLKWALRILAPTHKGRLLWRNNVMASNENIKWLKQDLYTCGMQLQKLSDLPGHLEQLLNIKLEVTKRTRGENENIYFNRRIVLADDAGAPGAAVVDTREQEPYSFDSDKVSAVRKALPAGDYSLVGLEERVAVALIREDGQVVIRDWPGDECALADVCSELSDLVAPDLVIIEAQQAMPKQGVVSTFKLGMNYGMWLAALACQGWSFKTVRPAEWKKGLGYPPEKKGSKAHSLTLARRLYPQAAHMLGRVCDHGRAEALLLAHLAKEGKVETEISFEEAIA